MTADTLPHGGGFDGSVIDADGVLWNAAWGGGSVSGFAPDGSLVRVIEVPAKQATCPCFTGAALDKMIVTSAWQRYDAAQRRADPKAGHTFEIAGGFSGLEAADFRLPSTVG